MKALKLTIIIVIAFALLWMVNSFISRTPVTDSRLPSEIPTREYIQQLLIKNGYDVGPKGADGKIGKDSNFAWEKAECDQFAVEMMERQGL